MTLKNIHFVLGNGWSCPDDIWDLLLPYVEDSSWSFLGQEVNLPEDKILVGLGYSLGFQKLLLANMPFSAYIGLHAFINFLGNDSALSSERRQELEAMIKYFQIYPQETVKTFHQKVGFSSSREYSHCAESLLGDLFLMRTSVSIPSVPTMIISANDDHIVPPSIIENNFRAHQNCQIIYKDKGGHNLLHQDPYFIYENIHSFLKDFHDHTKTKNTT